MSPELVSREVLLGAWVATTLSLFIYSFLYKDNPLFKLAEHIFVGASVGYLLTITYHEVMLKKLYVPLVEQGHWLLVYAVFCLCPTSLESRDWPPYAAGRGPDRGGGPAPRTGVSPPCRSPPGRRSCCPCRTASCR